MEISVHIREESKEDESMCDTPLRKGEEMNMTIGKVYLKDDKNASKDSLAVNKSIPMLNVSSKNLNS